ncbi:exopolyphosphatase isoform X3 [Tripterygium wilfordii]|uniref:exopolyphosphatase isoform X3 n=1 Tax=Tripterygium wilfordii TaxID=458696 RepID=UPI0018F845B7|nr:exopolyphosphatase isoform X3 [Tripterygium wilfordii]
MDHCSDYLSVSAQLSEELSEPRPSMAINLPPMAVNVPPSSRFASIDMGTNSFKLLIVQADPSGKFLIIDRVKDRVLLGLNSSRFISKQSQLRSLQCLQNFKQVMESNDVPFQHTRCVATAAVREAENREEFSRMVYENLGFEVDVLSGEEEARLVYLGVLQFLPIFDKQVLTVDIGGGSTEFAIGKQGRVAFGTSLKLGHVKLTQKFASNGEIAEMREFMKLTIEESGLVEKVKDCGFDVAVGSSGTIKSIENAIFNGFGTNLVYNNEVLVKECKKEWGFSRGELEGLVGMLCDDGREGENVKRERFFKRRSQFIVAGAVLLEEIFKALGIEEMEVSKYALGEGIIAETLANVYNGYNLNANARWWSTVHLATRFNGKKRMKSATECARIANNGGHLNGYDAEEVKLIALLTKHHRKKFPKYDHASFMEFSEEVRQKFRILCVIIRLSVILQQSQPVNFWKMECSHSQEGYRLAFTEVGDRSSLPATSQNVAEELGAELRQEQAYFKKVFQQELMIVVLSASES